MPLPLALQSLNDTIIHYKKYTRLVEYREKVPPAHIVKKNTDMSLLE